MATYPAEPAITRERCLKKGPGGRLGALGVLLEALDQEGGENAVHIDLSILYFLSFFAVFM